MLNYLQSIVGCQATANPVMDSPICLLLVQLLRAPQQGAFQVLLATILGLLVRHCTLIPPALAESGVSTTFSPSEACIPFCSAGHLSEPPCSASAPSSWWDSPTLVRAMSAVPIPADILYSGSCHLWHALQLQHSACMQHTHCSSGASSALKLLCAYMKRARALLPCTAQPCPCTLRPAACTTTLRRCAARADRGAGQPGRAPEAALHGVPGGAAVLHCGHARRGCSGQLLACRGGHSLCSRELSKARRGQHCTGRCSCCIASRGTPFWKYYKADIRASLFLSMH